MKEITLEELENSYDKEEIGAYIIDLFCTKYNLIPEYVIQNFNTLKEKICLED